jgi:adenylate cyclase
VTAAKPVPPARPASTPKPQAQRAKPRGLRLSLGLKFTFFLLLLIGAMMTLTMALTNRQQQRALRDEVLQRGVTIARGLASSATDPILKEDDLIIATLIFEAMPREDQTGYEALSLRLVLESLVEDLWASAASLPKTLPRNSGVVEVTLVDRKGVIRGHTNMQRKGEAYAPAPGLRPYQGEALLIQEYYTPQHEKLYDVAVPILSTIEGRAIRIGDVHVVMTNRLVDQVVRQAALKLLLLTGALLVLGLIATLGLAHYLTRPINQLVGGVMAIAAGDLNQELRLNRRDELGDLTTAFNEMAASLREKELIKGAFSTYVSSQVMEQVLADPGKLALGGARKRVTSLFADIRGFTSMSEVLQPEEVVSIINVYLSLQTEIVLRNEGLLDKFVGDCVMAVFGLPWARPDDALRAVRTAVEIQAAIKRLNLARAKEGQRTITVGIGVNTGEVVAGNMGSSQKMDYTVIGDAVNLAARLEACAEGGTILISETTFLEVQERVEAEKLAPIPVKGKKDKVTVYSVLGLKA